MRRIPLTQGQFALVDDEDYGWLMQWKWHAQRNRQGRFYAIRNARIGPERRMAHMHRVLLPGAKMVDHKDGDGLNNQRENLRPTTNAQNQRNRGRAKNNTSGFKGVFASGRKTNPWAAHIGHEGTQKRIGRFPTPEEAARAYDTAALQLHGEFAKLNFPIETK